MYHQCNVTSLSVRNNICGAFFPGSTIQFTHVPEKDVIDAFTLRVEFASGGDSIHFRQRLHQIMSEVPDYFITVQYCRMGRPAIHFYFVYISGLVV